MPGKVRHFPRGAQLFLSVSIDPQGTGVVMKTESLNAGRAQGWPPIGDDGGQLGCRGFWGQEISEVGPEKGELSGPENEGQCKLKVRWSRQWQQYTESLGKCWRQKQCSRSPPGRWKEAGAFSLGICVSVLISMLLRWNLRSFQNYTFWLWTGAVKKKNKK